MTKDEYVETLYIKGKKVDVGLDDYGQCYFFEYVDDKGEINSVGCGTYNSWYLEEIYGYFDYKGTTISLYGEEEWQEYINRLKLHYDRCSDDPEMQADILEAIHRAETDEYELYDFEQMYKEREGK